MVNAIVYILGLSNLLLALLTFVLLARPDKMLGILAYFSGDSEAFRLGKMLQHERNKLIMLGERIRWPVLILLFGWSFFCGALIRFLYT